MSEPSAAIVAYIDLCRRQGWDDDEILDACVQRHGLSLRGQRIVGDYLGRPRQGNEYAYASVEKALKFARKYRRDNWKLPTFDEIAAETGVSRSTLYRWRKNGYMEWPPK